MKKLLLIAVIALLGLSATAQTYKATGVVVDSTGAPLAMANVIAYQKNKSLGAFGITNQDGKYQLLNLKQDSTYTVKVSFLGLKPLEETFKPTKTDIVRNFMLVGGPESLDAVEITYQIPVTIKGDTITYNADSFTNGTEQKLGDVLKKLPGIEVNADGDIQVEGNNVEKVMVDGKDFFAGDSRLATKNIPANAVGEVEVLKNYNSQSQLKGLGNDQDRYVINIKLKEGKKKFWFGEATVGAGLGGGAGRYLAQPKAFYYSEDFSVNILTDFNNLGVPAFTGRDYFRFVGFRNFDTRQNNASINVNAASNFNPFPTNRALSIDSKFGALNSSWKVNDKLDVSAFAILSASKTRTAELRNDFYIVPENSDPARTRVTDAENDENALENNFAGIFKLGADYNPNKKLSIKYDSRFNISDQSQVQDLLSNRNEVTNNINQFVEEDIAQENTQRPISLNQTLNMYYTASENHILAFESLYLNQQEDPFYNAIRDRLNQTEIEPFNGQLNLTAADPYNINQERLVTTNKLDAKLDYWYVINKTSNINFTLGSVFSGQVFNSDIFQITDDGSRNELSAANTRNDDVTYDFRDIFLAAHYKLISGKFTFTPGVTMHNFQTKDVQLGIENVIDTQRLLPDLEVRYAPRSSETLSLNYDRNMTFSDIDNYALGFVFNNYNRLNSGNNQLEGSLNDRVRLTYRNFNMFNYTTMSGNITYTKQQDAIQSSTNLDGINQVSAPINSLFANERLNGNFLYGKEIKKITIGGSVTGSWSSFFNIIDGDVQESVNINHSYGVTARSNYTEGVNFDVGYNLGINDSDNPGNRNKATTNTYTAGADWQMGKGWLLKADYNLQDFKSSAGAKNTYDILNASLRYQKPESRWQYSLIATNLLNAEVNVQNNFGQIVTSTTQTFVLPRYVYFQMRFDL